MIEDDQEKLKAERIQQQSKETITKSSRQLLKARRRLVCQNQGCTEVATAGGTCCELCGTDCATCLKPVVGARTYCCSCNVHLHPIDKYVFFKLNSFFTNYIFSCIRDKRDGRRMCRFCYEVFMSPSSDEDDDPNVPSSSSKARKDNKRFRREWGWIVRGEWRGIVIDQI